MENLLADWHLVTGTKVSKSSNTPPTWRTRKSREANTTDRPCWSRYNEALPHSDVCWFMLPNLTIDDMYMKCNCMYIYTYTHDIKYNNYIYIYIYIIIYLPYIQSFTGWNKPTWNGPFLKTIVSSSTRTQLDDSPHIQDYRFDYMIWNTHGFSCSHSMYI